MACTHSVGDRSGERANQSRWKKNRAEHIQWHVYYVDGHYPAGARHHLHGAEMTVESIDHWSRRTWRYSKFPSTNIKGETELYKPPYSIMPDVPLCRGWLQLGNCYYSCLCWTRKQIFLVWRQTFIAEYYRASFKLPGDPIGAFLEIYTTLLERKGVWLEARMHIVRLKVNTAQRSILKLLEIYLFWFALPLCVTCA